MKKITLLFLCILISFPTLPVTSALGNKGYELLTGYSWSKPKSKNCYNFIPFLLDINYDLKPQLNPRWRPAGEFSFLLEPSISPTLQPDPNLEIGLSFLLKLGLLSENNRLQPYLKAGPGLSYSTQHLHEQATQFNFMELVAAGLHYYFRKDTALTLEFRYRHLSNAGIKHPNNGVNSSFALAGISRKF